MFDVRKTNPSWLAGLALACVGACDRPRNTRSTPPAVVAQAVTPDPADDAVLDRHRLACAVLARNPELAAWRESWRAANTRGRRPTSLGDTTLSYTFAPGSIGSDTVRYGQIVQISQSFRLGQTRVERRVAAAQADAAGHDYEARRQQLVLLATTLYDEYYAVHRALETNTEHHALVSVMLDTATARYSTGHAPQEDPIHAELELAHIEHERVVLSSQREVLVAQINGLLHRPPDTPLPPPMDRIATPTAGAYEEPVMRPEVEAATAREDAARRATTAARRRFAPSISATATYNSMWAMLQHQFMLGVGLAIPLQLGSLRAGIDEARAEHRAARYRREATEDAVAVEQVTARHELDGARHVVELHETRLLPVARARVEAARVGYETGANDFSSVIDAERELRSLELDHHRALADLGDRRAELDYALGHVADCEREGGDQ